MSDSDTRQRSFRLRTELIERLERRARRNDVSVNALAQRYVEEGLRHEDHPAIVMRPGAGGRRAALAGTRLDVWQVVATVRDNGADVTASAEYLSLSTAQVRACLAYYGEYQHEIDEDARLALAFAQHEQAAFKRQQAALGAA